MRGRKIEERKTEKETERRSEGKRAENLIRLRQSLLIASMV